MPKLSDLLLASDIDGTALILREGIPPQNIEAVRRFIGKGGRFTFATGRMPEMVELVTRQIPVNAPIVAANGAMLLEPGSLRVLEEKKITGEVHATARELVDRFDGRAAVFLALGNLYCPVAPSERSMQISRTHYLARSGAWKIEDAPREVHKFVLMTEDREETLRIRAELEPYRGRFGVVVSGQRIVELIPPGVSKGNGLRRVARMLGIAMENTVAVGDNENDLELLRAAAHSAAPGDADPAVRARVERVLCHCMDGALAELIGELERRCEAG